MTSVVRLPMGQLVTVGAQEVIVYTEVILMVEVRVGWADREGRMLPVLVVAFDD